MGKTFEALKKADKERRKTIQASFSEHSVIVAEKFHKRSDKALIRKKSKSVLAKMSSNQIQEIRTRLITRFQPGSIKTILLTGTASGCGNSTAASNLAITLAQNSNLNVLLVDANFRSPSLHAFFNIEDNQGLFQLLLKENDKALMFKKIGQGNLCVVPCGQNSNDAMNLFDSDSFAKTLKRMRAEFDYVLFDAPPVNGHLDALMIGAMVDGIILIIESGKTRRQVALNAKRELEAAGGKILGVVLNRRKYHIPEWIYRRM